MELRWYSSAGAAAKEVERTGAQETSEDLNFNDLPDQGDLEPLSQRRDSRRYLDDLEDESFYEPGSPVEETQMPLGRPYTTAANLKHVRELEVAQQEEDPSGKRVHVLGVDPRAYFIAHRLCGYEHLDPIKLLINKTPLMNTWVHEGKRLLMIKGDKRVLRNRVEAEWVGKGRAFIPGSDHIEQLVVTLPCWQTRSAIHNIRHRIDNRTTICLVQDGLGVVEELNATLFEDPTTRPTYVLGHMGASLGYHRGVFFASTVRAPGKLYLTALERGIGIPNVKFHPPAERRPHAVKFMRTMVATDGLGAGGYSYENYLMRKLPEMVFQCIVEPIAIAIDSTYDQVLRNEYAILLADELLEELFNVIWALPELTNSSKILDYCGMEALRKYTLDRLVAKGQARSPLLSAVRAGKMVDVDYLNGYFVRRGSELGIKMPQNEMLISAIKARVEERRKQLRGLVPFEGLATPSHSVW